MATIVFGLSHTAWLSLVALAFVGGTDMVSMVIRDGLVQLNTPDEMRGRVNAAEGVFIGASNQLGAFVIALWAKLFPGLRRADRYVEI